MAPPSALDPPALTDTQTATFFDRLSVNGIATRRSKAPKMSGGIAPHASSDMFKSPAYGKPKAKRWDRMFCQFWYPPRGEMGIMADYRLDRLNEETKSRKDAKIKGAAVHLKKPGIITLGGGLPSSEHFPFERIDIKVPKPPRFSEQECKESGMVMSAGKHDIAEGKSLYDLHVALNYSQATGSLQLLRFVTEHTEMIHHPPYQDWHCTLTAGNTSAFDMALRMFTKRGDYILAEEYTFATAIASISSGVLNAPIFSNTYNKESAIPMGLRVVGVEMDDQGLIPSSLDHILSHWDAKARGGSKPWLLYIIPTGQNPTGTTQSEKRRHETYRCAQKHDLYILEDEPYYFLQMQPYTGTLGPKVPPPSSHEAFISALVPSYLSMDIDGRVMRLDSVSKVLAPGARVGWITASEQIVERIVRHQERSTQAPSGISQIVLFKLLDEAWGHAGYLDWLIDLRLQYTERRDNICHACEKYMPREVASWITPDAGMFAWIKIDWRSHPHSKSKSMLEIEDEIFLTGIERGVLCTKGSWFRAESDGGEDMYFRLTFAAAPSGDVEEAVRRFGEALRVSFESV